MKAAIMTEKPAPILPDYHARIDVYWDACLFYEYFGGETEGRSAQQLAGTRGVMREVQEGRLRIVTSLLTQLEVVPSKLDAKRANANRKFLASFDAVRMVGVEVTPNVISRAREIRDFYYEPGVPEERDEAGKLVSQMKAPRYMDLGDCVHVATATLYNVGTLHTRDGTRTKKKNKRNNVSLLEVGQKSNGLICDRWKLHISEPNPSEAALFDDPSHR